jgi:hypothetical protein
MEIKNTLEKTIRHLAEIRRQVAALPSEEALDRILSASEPAALVHSFPEQDLHLLVHDIGIADALPILKLASNRQWEYFFDVEAWDRDRVDLDAVTRWANLFLSADPFRMAHWAGHEKVEFFEYYLFKNIQVVVREHDQDPSEIGDDFFTLDDVFYIRILDDPSGPARKADESRRPLDEDRRRLLTHLLKRLADEDSVRFHQILLEAMHVIPAETEEATYRRRNIRMAEKGFLPFDEAIGIYQPLTVDDIRGQSDRREYRPLVDSKLPVARFAVRWGDDQNPVMRALEVMDTDAHRSRIEMELVGLANRLIVADQKLVRNRADLKYAVQKACGYISIGLTGLAAEDGDPALALAPDPSTSAAIMARYSLPRLFRLGFGYALRLKWRADRWYRKSWFQQQRLVLTFWGETWMGVLGGLLIKKPRYFDETREDQRYREFTAMTDIIETDAALGRIIAMDEFLNRMSIDLQRSSDVFLTYKNLILTRWARDDLELSPEVKPIELSLFRPFYADRLFASQKSKRPDASAQIRLSAKQSFLDGLIRQSGLSEEDIMTRIGPTLDELFAEIESELGRVDPENLDPRFVSLFLLK